MRSKNIEAPSDEHTSNRAQIEFKEEEEKFGSFHDFDSDL